jgi:hypothetical protein
MHLIRQASCSSESVLHAKPLLGRRSGWSNSGFSNFRPNTFGASVTVEQVGQKNPPQRSPLLNRITIPTPDRTLNLKPDAERFYQATTGRSFSAAVAAVDNSPSCALPDLP